ncbi:hypothetical protein M1924_27500 [Klebsiella pneumoniae]|nr:hypothetical protein [Klebsiella pneumoniae]MDZ2676164.1 hypothetical protein [Klebsiella pneumoniae]HDI3220423.1 hypothetical protein [Klebsiella pneumoniae]HDI3331636.1 hypothetical protein [Klebsiella pneumoniae]HDS8993439.1 hypothetical protein [Klebsiella pneumoniae subsp. pneumoniae]
MFNLFVNQSSISFNRTAPVIKETKLHQLMAWRWPGNVRELRNEAERFVLGIKSTITMGDISSDISSFSLMQTVEYFERGLIATELARHAGSLSRTAESLQVAKSTLSDKIKIWAKILKKWNSSNNAIN